MDDTQLLYALEMRRNLTDMRDTLNRLLADIDVAEGYTDTIAQAAFVRHWRDVMHARLDRAAVSLGKAAQDAQGVLKEQTTCADTN